MRPINPPQWGRPKGYSNGIIAEGKMFFLAGVVGWNETETFTSDDLIDQFRQALLNIRTILAAGHCEPAHITRMTWYLTNMAQYRNHQAEFGVIYQEIMGKHFPVMACIGISELLEPRAKIEIEVTAMVP